MYDLQNFNQQDQSIENIKKLPPQNYDFDIKKSISLTSIDDKFDLSPKLLTIKEILGSGAYGVVRMGSLQDTFNNIMDVAVKMLKGSKEWVVLHLALLIDNK